MTGGWKFSAYLVNNNKIVTFQTETSNKCTCCRHGALLEFEQINITSSNTVAVNSIYHTVKPH